MQTDKPIISGTKTLAELTETPNQGTGDTLLV